MTIFLISTLQAICTESSYIQKKTKVNNNKINTSNLVNFSNLNKI